MTWKRLFDLVVGGVVGPALSPFIVVVGGVVFITSGRPVLLRQERVGARGQTFGMFKFRTMRRGTPLVAKSHLVGSPYAYTQAGPFLRRWSLDELPQILNVLRGEMSLVGPRPALASQMDLLALRRKRYVDVLAPGVTGLAQVKGREALTLASKVRFEALYLRRSSIGFDALILIWTIRALFSKRGAY